MRGKSKGTCECSACRLEEYLRSMGLNKEQVKRALFMAVEIAHDYHEEVCEANLEKNNSVPACQVA